MLIAWSNKADAAALSTDSQKSTLPATNVQDPHVARKWHAAAGVTSAYLVLDLGSALLCDTLALLGTNFSPTGTVRVRAASSEANLTAAPTLDTGALTGAAKAGYGAIYKNFTDTTARWWRLDLADASATGGNLRVGRVFLGPSWTPTLAQLFDWGVASVDESPAQESHGGQEYDEEKPQRRVIAFALDYLNEAEMYGNAFALARANGRVRDVLVVPDLAGSYLSEQALWGKLNAAEPRFLRHRLPNIYRQEFTVRERL